MKAEDLERLPVALQTATVIMAANKLGILGRLAGGAAEPAALARVLGLGERGTVALCDALVSLGVLRRRGAVVEVVEELRAALDPAGPRSVAAILEHHWHVQQRWARLDEVVTSGEALPRPSADVEQLRAFILGMADLARRESAGLWEAVDLGGRHHLVDVGGGPGELALAALERWPDLEATILDRSEVLEIAREYAAPRQLGSRLHLVPGDVLAGPIPECDVALLSALLHSYGVDDVRKIARHVAVGVRPGGMLIIREFMWDDASHSSPVAAGLFAVNMLVGTPGGRCYAAVELEELFGPVGFGQWRSSGLDPRSTVLVGVKL